MRVVEEARQDRRHLRRAQTIEELIGVAVQVMAEHGAAGLSLGEVARRMGVRPPSLYVYVDSKNAVYDAVFAQGWREVHEVMLQLPEPDARSDAPSYLQAAAEAFVRWSIAHPVHSQLMGWRPVPGYKPSVAAYEPAIATLELARARMAQLRELGFLRDDVPLDEVVGAWTVLISGVVSQQLANAPEQSFEEGTFTRLLPTLVAMFAAHFAPAPRRRTTKPKGTR
jgi:AcrR family transcriptional regulator